jgi:hypothetical protein
MDAIAAIGQKLDLDGIVSRGLADQVHRWSAMCGAVLAWERQDILGGNPTETERQKHREAVKILLRWSRFIQAMLADPDIHDRSLLAEIEGRVLQLESSWETLTEPTMDDREAASLLKEAFPGEADQQLIKKLFPESSQ